MPRAMQGDDLTPKAEGASLKAASPITVADDMSIKVMPSEWQKTAADL